MESNLYKQKKLAKKKLKKQEEKENKKEARLQKKIKTSFDWIDIEDVSDDGIYLKKEKVVYGIRINPINIFLLPTAEVEKKIRSLAMAFNQLNQRLYIQFPLTEPHLDDVFNYFLTLQEKSNSEIVSSLIQSELDKIMLYESTHRDVWFYWMIQTSRKYYEDDVKQLLKLADISGLSYQRMKILDYKNVIYDKFRNPLLNNCFFPTMNGYTINLAKMRENIPFLKSRAAPFRFHEKNFYIELNDHCESANLVLNYPLMFAPGLLSSNVANPEYRLEICIDPIRYNVNKLMDKRLKQIVDEQRVAKSDFDIKDLEMERIGISNTILEGQQSKLSCVDLTTVIYPSAPDPEKLMDSERNLNLEFSPNDGWTITKLNSLHAPIFKETSPLFINSGLRKDQKEQMGNIMPCSSAAGLWPYIFETLDDEGGGLIGVESTTGGHIIFDPFLYEDHQHIAVNQNRLNNNLFITGLSGSGKTTFVKMLIMQQLMIGNRVIYVDPENVVQNMIRQLNGTYIDWKTSQNMINVFDLKPQTNDEIDDRYLIYNTKHAIANNIEDVKILYESIHPNITDDELSMLDDVVNETYKLVGINEDTDFKNLPLDAYPTFTTLYSTLDTMMGSAQKRNMQIEFENLQKLKIKTKPFISSYARFFDGHTNFDDNSPFIAFGMKEAQNKSDKLMQALTRVVFQKAWEKVLDSQGKANLAFDESHKYILASGVADSFAQFARRARKFKASCWFITQQGSDYDDPMIKTHGNAIISNCAYKFLMSANDQEYARMQKIYGLNSNQIRQMNQLPMGRGMFVLGNHKMLMDVYVTEDQIDMM